MEAATRFNRSSARRFRMASKILQLLADNLVVTRGERRVLDGVSFAVAGGEALVLTGANGAGKTTLIRVIAGFLEPGGGELKLMGGDAEISIGQRCHYIGHSNGLKSNLTVEENLGFWARYLGGDGSTSGGERVEMALDRFGLIDLHDIPAGYLSAGQKRRLGLARLLVAERPIWLLDEPSVSLDAGSVAVLAAVVNQHLGAGGIAVAATHVALDLKSQRELRLAPAAVTA